MAFFYTSRSYGTPILYEADTLEEAVGVALADMDSGEAWPEEIDDVDGNPLWRHSGPITTRKSLISLATENGIILYGGQNAN